MILDITRFIPFIEWSLHVRWFSYLKFLTKVFSKTAKEFEEQTT